jgi:hypothetical protein
MSVAVVVALGRSLMTMVASVAILMDQVAVRATKAAIKFVEAVTLIKAVVVGSTIAQVVSGLRNGLSGVSLMTAPPFKTT